MLVTILGFMLISSSIWSSVVYAAPTQETRIVQSQEGLPPVEDLISTMLFDGSLGDEGVALEIDEEGYVYLLGTTDSSDFPLVNPYDSQFQGESEIFLMKVESDLSEVHFATFIGGAGKDIANAIAIDEQGFVYVAGVTNSSDFSWTYNHSTDSGGEDAFVMKIDPTSGAPISSILLGGSEDDVGNGIVINSVGDVVLVGRTWSEDFPLLDAIDNTLNGSLDCFMATISSNGTLLFSTFIGGSEADYPNDIAIGPHGNIHITGSTQSSDFPSAPFGWTLLSGESDCFVLKVNSTDYSFEYSTLIGGFEEESSRTIVVDEEGNAIIGGITTSINFPTPNGFDSSFGGGGRSDGFLLKLGPNGENIHYSTFIGGDESDGVSDIAIDDDGSVFISGYSHSRNFPYEDRLPIGPLTDLWNIVLMRLCLNESGIQYSTHFGGSYGDSGKALALLDDGEIIVTGFTLSNDFMGIEDGQSDIARTTCFLSHVRDLTDTDNDNLRDIFEKSIGTDIHLQDSDQDSFGDYWEVVNGFDPLDQNVVFEEYILMFVQNYGVWIISGVGLVVIILGYRYGRNRLLKFWNQLANRIVQYRDRIFEDGSVPFIITALMILATLIPPYAMLPYSIIGRHDAVTIVEGMMLGLFWVILPPSISPTGLQIFHPQFILTSIGLGVFNIIFAGQVYRLVEQKTSFKLVLLSGILTLVIPIAWTLGFLSYTFVSYVGPIPIQLAIGLVIALIFRKKEIKTPWNEPEEDEEQVFKDNTNLLDPS